ncbi:glutamate--cysteine ligase regulatory subunit [Hermetia illucens]|uniref:glutamate--cysteine ligase regulatory subunit n=1 Tax=Hermetia illucens TaxID=343691 RepID=UPI0018CC6933|nr:glutamate--cysteine ligase regulatory subunit [Hermetia illucens]
MLNTILDSKLDSFVISTGNVLNVNKKAGQKPTEELIDCLAVTMTESIFNEKEKQLQRAHNELAEKIDEHGRDDIKVGVKIFLNNDSVEYLNEAVIATLKVLNLECLDNVILAYHPCSKSGHTANGVVDEAIKNDNFEWGANNGDAINNLKELWTHLEKFAKSKKICQLGIADLDVDSLKELHQSAVVPPSVAQINLSACCVVPPPLQQFCTANDIPLLTHSDPNVILPKDALEKTLGLKDYDVAWTARYQVHVKCRGLLIVKGFIVGAKRK